MAHAAHRFLCQACGLNRAKLLILMATVPRTVKSVFGSSKQCAAGQCTVLVWRFDENC